LTKVSVLIPFIPDTPRRRQIFDHVLARWGHFFPDYELVSASDGGGEVYNKAQAINNAAKIAAGDVFIIADADIIWNPETIRQAVDMVASGAVPWLIPFTDCERLDERTTQRILAGKPEDDTPEQYGVLSGPSHGPGAMNVLTREAWEKAGGYDENFCGWGYEDNAFELMLDTFHGKAGRLPDRMFHLCHPRAPSAALLSPQRQANKRRMMAYTDIDASGDTERLKALKNQALIPPRVDALVLRGRHYIDHIAPIWNALPPEYRGTFYTDHRLIEHAATHGITATGIHKQHIARELARDTGLVLLAGHADSQYTDPIGRKSVIAMHGVGFNFDQCKTLPNYPGTSANRQHVVLMLSTNEQIAAIERAGNPDIPVVVVGCPKLDRWQNRPRKRKTKKPVVAFAWHWRCQVAPEAGTAWDFYKSVIPKIAEHYTVIGHGHPNIIDELEPHYRAMGIECVRELDEVFERADILVADATSAMYEWAALDRPLVVCNCPQYRRDIDFGLRFWKHADVGVNCDSPDALLDAITEAWKDSPKQKKLRRDAAAYAYTYLDGECSRRAADAIIEAANRHAKAPPPTNTMNLARSRTQARLDRRAERLRRIAGG
jgi:hypothetical protein